MKPHDWLYLVSGITGIAAIVLEVREKRKGDRVWRQATTVTLDGNESSSSQSSAQDLPS